MEADAEAMPSNTQEFCLRWNNFQSSLVSALDGFKNDLDFVDVTVACEGRHLKAHKMLLSACSVFFCDLLKANPCQHPIVILPSEVKFIDLERLLRFIYQGEVNVQQEHLARFLKTAEMLKIRGLADDSEKKVLQASPRISDGNGNDDASISPKRARLSIDTHTSFQDVSHISNEDNSRMSGADSDSEMLPVKQEMICSEFENLDGENVITDTYIKEGSSSCNESRVQGQSAPPPPGPILPSYVPPPQLKSQDGLARSSSQPVGGLIRRFMEECLQLPEPGVLLACYSGLEGTPHFQLLRSVAKEWSYCRNATSNYSSMGGRNKRQRATSRLIETFENIDSLRSQLAQYLHQLIVIEISAPGTVAKACQAEIVIHESEQVTVQNVKNDDVVKEEVIETEECMQKEMLSKITEVMKQLRKLYFDQSRRLAVRISQLKKGQQQCQERVHRQQQQNYLQQALQQLQRPQDYQNVPRDANLQFSSHSQLNLHQPWSD